MHSLTFPWNSVCVTSLLCQSVCLSVCRSVFLLLTCTSRHSALCFRLSMSTLHSCVDLICDVGFSLSPACLFFFFFALPPFASSAFTSSSITEEEEEEEMLSRPQTCSKGNLLTPSFWLVLLPCSFCKLSSWFLNNTQGTWGNCLVWGSKGIIRYRC